MARMISAVTVNFGTAERIRSMRDGFQWLKRRTTGPKLFGFGPALESGLEALDLVPQRAVLGLVGGPYLLLRHFAEFLDVGFHHGHAERFEFRLGLGEIVDRLGGLADLH